MARLNVNPTRMELKRLKARLKTATRGHKLLKDKSDEMIRIFSVRLRQNKKLRIEVEDSVSAVFKNFAMAGGVSLAEELLSAFSMPATAIGVETGMTSVMGVEVPKLSVTANKGKHAFPYAFSYVTSEADKSIKEVNGILEKLLQLAELEKSCRMLAMEIEKNTRRVNALEFVMIPQLEETIKYISIKLDENERSNIVRMMKVKSLITQE